MNNRRAKPRRRDLGLGSITPRPVGAGCVLDLCGGTGSWSKPYREAGYSVVVVDPLAEGPDDFRGTVAEFAMTLSFGDIDGIDGVLCAPPCDHFSVSGAQYWPAKDADGRTAAAVQIVRDCLGIVDAVNPRWWVLENPIGRIAKLVPELGPPVMRFDPCDYGDPWTKRTQLWGKFRPPMKTPVQPIRSTTQGSWLMALGGKSAKTKRLRSMTPPGFARAFFGANP